MSNPDFLVEIGTEELPPKALRSLSEGFADNLAREAREARLSHGEVHAFASPRRLAVCIDGLAPRQPDRSIEQKGPPVSLAFDDDGKPKPPALAFARKCGVDVKDLGRTRNDKGEWLCCDLTEAGRTAAELMRGLVANALAALPIPRRMRWGAGDAEFVRPVHWVVMLHGDAVVEGTVLGIETGRETRGHRFHANRAIPIANPGAYADTLEAEGKVIADFARRREIVEAGVAAAAQAVGGTIVDGERLFDEVAALVEWPVPIVGSFDEEFLALPREVVVSTLAGHQRYFPLAGPSGALLPKFVTVANLESQAPDRVRDGNERVVRPRLADAAFFWEQDRRTPLADRQAGLEKVVYQQGLGSLHDKSARVTALATVLAADLGWPTATVERAAQLAKCDLASGMVGEFPELQGTMGGYYARADGEPEPVATAIGEHYLPRFAGDALPSTVDGQLLSVADKLDTISGVFALGRKPSGNRDPFALRRAALGIVRILVECRLDIDLKAAIQRALEAQPVSAPNKNSNHNELAADVYAFLVERLRNYFLERDPGLAAGTFDAVLLREPASLVDFADRLAAVQDFVALDEAASLAAANKRIANILRKSADADGRPAACIDESLFADAAETQLHTALASARDEVMPLLARRDYTDALRQLAQLKQPIDRFFDEVLVMTDDPRVRDNRLSLLASVREEFLQVADISRLAIE